MSKESNRGRPRKDPGKRVTGTLVRIRPEHAAVLDRLSGSGTMTDALNALLEREKRLADFYDERGRLRVVDPADEMTALVDLRSSAF